LPTVTSKLAWVGGVSGDNFSISVVSAAASSPEPKDREKANRFWKKSIQTLQKESKEEDLQFFQAWLRSRDEPQACSREIERKTYDGPLFPAIKDGKYGFIDIKDNVVIPPIFTSAKYFSEGLAAVQVGGRSYIDSLPGSGQYIGSEKGKWGYIDRTGEIKIPPQFSEAREFSEWLARIGT